MKTNREQLRELLKTLAATEPHEIDCAHFLDRVGAYLESLERRGQVPAELRAVSQHIEVCGECREEFEALVELHLGQ